MVRHVLVPPSSGCDCGSCSPLRTWAPQSNACLNVTNLGKPNPRALQAIQSRTTLQPEYGRPVAAFRATLPPATGLQGFTHGTAPRSNSPMMRVVTSSYKSLRMQVLAYGGEPF